MKYPIRSNTHKIEAKSWSLLLKLAPDTWIVREVSERDYGIDAYIEIITKSGEVTGNLISIQLKGVSKINWQNVHKEYMISSCPQIKTSTARYWLNLPVPVFLFIADLSTDMIYYIPVKENIRSHYEKLSKQSTITFKLFDRLKIDSKNSNDLFNFFTLRERLYPQFTFYVTNLLSNIELFGNFIIDNQNYDSFMEVDSERHLQLRVLYETCHIVAIYLNSDWKIESLDDTYKKDQKKWKDTFTYLHEESLDYILRKLQLLYLNLVKDAIELVSETQQYYWQYRDPVFYRLCSCGEFNDAIRRLEKYM